MAENERRGEHQKQKLLYLAKLFTEETDAQHALGMAEIIDKLAACGVNADRKTLYLDFQELRDFGMEIEAVYPAKAFTTPPQAGNIISGLYWMTGSIDTPAKT